MSSKNSTNATTSAFVSRLVELLGTDEPSAIQRRLKISYQSAKNYLQGRKPAPDVLERIVMATDVSLNWLLMGQGPKYLREEFDVERAISMHDDWLDVMKDWYDFEKRPMPDDAVGVRLMGGWNAYPTNSQKADAIRELKTLWDLARLRTDAADDDEKD